MIARTSGGFSPMSGGLDNYTFDFPINLEQEDSNGYEDASVIQLFYAKQKKKIKNKNKIKVWVPPIGNPDEGHRIFISENLDPEYAPLGWHNDGFSASLR